MWFPLDLRRSPFVYRWNNRSSHPFHQILLETYKWILQHDPRRQHERPSESLRLWDENEYVRRQWKLSSSKSWQVIFRHIWFNSHLRENVVADENYCKGNVRRRKANKNKNTQLNFKFGTSKERKRTKKKDLKTKTKKVYVCDRKSGHAESFEQTRRCQTVNSREAWGRDARDKACCPRSSRIWGVPR